MREHAAAIQMHLSKAVPSLTELVDTQVSKANTVVTHHRTAAK
jgi:hypothetical protein